MDLELIFSRDGRQWQRPLRGGFIPRDPKGPDREGIYPTNAWIDQGDRWLCLYTATSRKHNQSGNTDLPHTCVMAATWLKHRFVGLRAGNVTGGFTTPTFYLQHAEITLDADVRGWLRAELCDAWGRKLDGYHLEHSIVTHGDSAAHALRWADKDTAGLRHDPLRLRLEYCDGVVYSVTF